MVVKFLDKPVTELDPEKGSRCFQLIRPFRFIVDKDLIEIPAGFYTDWASTGPAASIISPIDSTICRPALAHDFLYFVGWLNSKTACDKVLANGMLVEGAPMWKRTIVYIGVLIGGLYTWRRYRRDNTKYVQVPQLNSLRQDQPLTLLTVANWKCDEEGVC
jgi:hypothetical protein